MKLHVEATPQELLEKGTSLVKSIGNILRPVSPDLADALIKALPKKESELKFPVLREIQKQTEAEYEAQMKLMLKDIGKVLDGKPILEKSGGPYQESPDYTGEILDTEEKRYERIKQELINRGYVASDFEQGGPLYGYSTNELIDLIRDKRND